MQKEAFRREAGLARLMMNKLNDADINSIQAQRYLNKHVDTELMMVINLWASYCYLMLVAMSLEENGWEISDDWKCQLTSVCDHIMERCLPWLDNDQQEEFLINQKNVLLEAIRMTFPLPISQITL